MDIAETMNLTAAAVRYHLAHLRKDNLIEIAPDMARSERRGRPAQMYCPASQAIPHNLVRLAGALLETTHELPRGNDEEFWSRLAIHMSADPPDAASLNRRLPLAVERLNRMNYNARWEAGPRGPRILLTNCPYAALLPAYPGLCFMDSHILERLLGKPVIQTARIDQENSRVRACVFETRK